MRMRLWQGARSSICTSNISPLICQVGVRDGTDIGWSFLLMHYPRWHMSDVNCSLKSRAHSKDMLLLRIHPQHCSCTTCTNILFWNTSHCCYRTCVWVLETCHLPSRVSQVVPTDLLHAAFTLGPVISGGLGSHRKQGRREHDSWKKKKTAGAQSYGINEEAGQEVPLQSSLDRWEILSLERYESEQRYWHQSDVCQPTADDPIMDAWKQIPSNYIVTLPLLKLHMGSRHSS